jgi:hypothetical protein
VLVLVGKGAGDIQSGQQSKDIRLKTLDHELEEGQHNANTEGKWANQLQTKCTLGKMFSTQDKYEQQQVARKHICKETQ